MHQHKDICVGNVGIPGWKYPSQSKNVQCMVRWPTEHVGRKVMTFDCFAFFCASQYIALYAVMTASLLCLNFWISCTYSQSHRNGEVICHLKASLQSLVVSWGISTAVSESSSPCSLITVTSSDSSSVKSVEWVSRTFWISAPSNSGNLHPGTS